jgi:hypothetical protein
MNHDSRSFEDDLFSLKADVAVIRSNYATRTDLQTVRLEVQQIRVELKAEIQDCRSELKAEIQDSRLDMKTIEANSTSRLVNLKIELKEEISKLRVDNEKLRAEMHALMSQVQTSLNAQTWRIIGAISSLVVAVYFIARAGY